MEKQNQGRGGLGHALNGTQLKWIALVTMAIDHAGLVLAGPCPPLYWTMRLIGRTAFPLYCFLLVEGFCHTGNVNRYLMRLGVFALISELPFDWMNGFLKPGMGSSGLSACFLGQNVFFTLFLGLLALKGYVTLQNRGNRLLSLLWCMGIGALAWWMRTDYGWAGVALIWFLYRFRGEPIRRLVFGYGTMVLGVDLSEMTALAGFLLMQWYSGERGSSRFRWGFYIFYPAHILVLMLIRHIL